MKTLNVLVMFFLSLSLMANEVTSTDNSGPEFQKTILEMSVGTNHSCEIVKEFLENSKFEIYLKCWGNNIFGQLGLGDYGNNWGDEKGERPSNQKKILFDSNPMKVASGKGHSCVLLENGQVKCWGDNFFGQLGLGHSRSLRNSDGREAREFRISSVNLGKGRIKDIRAGEDFTCVLFNNGKVKCWGANFFGQLGLGDKQPRGVKPEDMGENLPYIDFGTFEKISQISLGGSHACAKTYSGKVFCWGNNQNGQLGLGDRDNRGDNPYEIYHEVALGKGIMAKKIVSGGSHTCALLKNGLVKCWGKNFSGQLGLGDKLDRGISPEQMGDQLPSLSLVVKGGKFNRVEDLAAGEDFSCAAIAIDVKVQEEKYMEKRVVKCWGDNIYGQLGLGDIENRGDEPLEMGENLNIVPVANNIPIIQVQEQNGLSDLGGVQKLISGGNHICAMGEDFEYDEESDASLDKEIKNCSELGPKKITRGKIGNNSRADEEPECFVRCKKQFLRCWGANIYGQLGIGGRVNIGDRKFGKINVCMVPVDNFDPEQKTQDIGSKIPDVDF